LICPDTILQNRHSVVINVALLAALARPDI
jgi:hypothetical protein